MALHCLALLGSKNETLYLCSPFTEYADNNVGIDADTTKDEDVFGFIEDLQAGSSTQRKTMKPPMRLEVKSEQNNNSFGCSGKA
jgi:hypothetical protein